MEAASPRPPAAMVGMLAKATGASPNPPTRWKAVEAMEAAAAAHLRSQDAADAAARLLSQDAADAAVLRLELVARPAADAEVPLAELVARPAADAADHPLVAVHGECPPPLLLFLSCMLGSRLTHSRHSGGPPMSRGGGGGFGGGGGGGGGTSVGRNVVGGLMWSSCAAFSRADQH